MTKMALYLAFTIPMYASTALFEQQLEQGLVGSLLLLLFLAIGLLFFILSTKQYTIKNVPSELEDFLNMLYRETKKGSDEALKQVDLFLSSLNTHEENRIKTITALNTFVQHMTAEMTDTKNQINAVQELALSKEEKIRRYEEGYDLKIIKQFVSELLRIQDFIKTERLKEDSAALSEIEDDLTILLENNGVEKIKVSENELYSGYEKVAKVVDTEYCSDKEKHLTIKSIVKDGYYIHVDDNQHKIIRPTEVILYKIDTNEGEE